MNKSIYIWTSDLHSQKSSVSLAILEAMKKESLKVGYFKPIVSSRNEENPVLLNSSLGISTQESSVYELDEVIALERQGKTDEIFDTIIRRYKDIEQRFDFVLVEASDMSEATYRFELEWNTAIAKSLNIPIGWVTRSTSEDLVALELGRLHSEKIPVRQVFLTSSEMKEVSNLSALYPSVDFYNLEEIRHNGVSLKNKIFAFQPKGMTPRIFQYEMVEKAKKAQKHIVLPEGSDDRILKAASQLASDALVYLTVLGEEKKISERIKELGLEWDTQRIRVTDPATDSRFDSYAEKLYELRKSKGLELSQAQDLMRDASYFGTMMVYMGDADGMVSGAVNTTAHTIRPSLQFVKTKAGVNTVSSVFFMLLPDRALVYGDCAIVPNPTAEQLAEIAITSAESAKAFGIAPKVALLSYSSGNSGSGPDVDKVRTATEIVKTQRPDLLVEGPIQYDAAVDPRVGRSKMPNSPVAGQANVLIFPDLNAGNNAYKAVQRETGALAIGPVLQGLRKPVNDLSRGATIPDIYNTVLITAIQAVMEQ